MDVVGYVLARRHDFHGADGEVMAMHVLPEHRGRGHGRELLAAAVRELQSSGCSSVGLSTLEANPIREWYEALGGEPVNVTQDDIDGWIVREVVYRWDNPAQLLSRLRHRPCR